jgi:cytochrome c-type biogenesis protein
MGVGSLGLAFVAGMLSTLSPCVLPILPIVLGASVAQHRLAPLALATGLALSFTAIGLFVATIGFSIGLDSDVFRVAAAVLLIGVGVVLIVPPLQRRLAAAASPLSGWMQQRFGGFSAQGVGGQFALGLLLGTVWVPCVGPTLGAASLLASQGRDLWQVATVMLSFGIGATVPLLLIGALSRTAFAQWRGRLLSVGSTGKLIVGAAFVAIGLLISAGLDKSLETKLVDLSPQWLTDFTTQF